jgi:hypothetical protein
VLSPAASVGGYYPHTGAYQFAGYSAGYLHTYPSGMGADPTMLNGDYDVSEHDSVDDFLPL